jgi:hypothetical protein
VAKAHHLPLAACGLAETGVFHVWVRIQFAYNGVIATCPHGRALLPPGRPPPTPHPPRPASLCRSPRFSLSLLCVAEMRATRPNGEWGYSTRRHIYWAPSAQRRCHPEEALYLPTFSHLLIGNERLSLSLSRSLSVSFALAFNKKNH